MPYAGNLAKYLLRKIAPGNGNFSPPLAERKNSPATTGKTRAHKKRETRIQKGRLAQLG